MLSPVMGQDIYDVGQPIADQGKLTRSGTSCIQLGKAISREEAQNLCQSTTQHQIKVTQRQMWYYFVAPRIPPAKVE